MLLSLKLRCVTWDEAAYLHLVATGAAPNASCGVKPQAARGSGAEPVAAAAAVYVRDRPGRDTMPKALGPAATTRPLFFKAESQAGWMCDKAGTIAF